MIGTLSSFLKHFTHSVLIFSFCGRHRVSLILRGNYSNIGSASLYTRIFCDSSVRRPDVSSEIEQTSHSLHRAVFSISEVLLCHRGLLQSASVAKLQCSDYRRVSKSLYDLFISLTTNGAAYPFSLSSSAASALRSDSAPSAETTSNSRNLPSPTTSSR